MTRMLRLDRRRFLVQSALTGAAVLVARRHAWAAAPSDPVVDTASGKIRGAAADGINAFKGIPYSASTGGANRFMPPQKPVPWSGVREAMQIGARCPQPPTPGLMPEEAIDLDYGPMSEDCLSLNVWTAGVEPAAKRPVMVWFHGGGYATGSG